MVHISVVVFLAFAVCLFAFVSANAAAVNNEKEEAKQVVDAAKQLAGEVFRKAESELNKTKVDLEKVKPFKNKAEAAKSHAEQAAAQAETTAEKNENAKVIVKEIQNISTTVNTLYQNTMGDIKRAVDSIDALLLQAETLKNTCNIDILPSDKTSNNYTNTKKIAADLKTNADNLSTSITSFLQQMNSVDSIAQQLEKSAEEAQVTNLHVSAIVAVAKIDAMLGKSDGILINTQNQRDAVNGIVQHMQKHCITDLVDSYEIIKEQCNSANDELTKAKAAVQKSQNAVAAIKEQKGLADTALENVQKEGTVLSAAEEEVRKADECVATVQRSFLQLQSALQTDENFVTKAKDSQQKLVAALSTTTTKPSTEQITATANAGSTLGDGTERDQKDTKIQPTSKDSLTQSNNSTDILKEALNNGAQNVPTTALTGGKAPAPGAKNDSAMTVSVPLLVALIASAVWQ